MKRWCKNIDITNRELISEATWSCLQGKMTRADTIRMFVEYTGLPYEFLVDIAKKHRNMLDGVVEAVIDGIRQEIIDRKYTVKKIRHKLKIDSCTGKLRKIGIQDIKQQIYDYIAVYALEELFRKKLCYYQTGAVKKKGNDFGAGAIYNWLADKNNRIAWQADVRHYYESIDKRRLKRMLARDVDNEPLLHLVFFLIDTFESGLSIGSYLSQFLANYYLSKAYIYAGQLYKERKAKDGSIKRVSLVNHVLFQMDDILFIGHSEKDMRMAVRKFTKHVNKKLGLELKESARYIDLRSDYIDILGRKASRKNLTIRSSTFLRMRRTLKKAYAYLCKGEEVPYRLAKSCVSRYGPLKHTHSKRFARKYHVNKIIKKCELAISQKERGNTRDIDQFVYFTPYVEPVKHICVPEKQSSELPF